MIDYGRDTGIRRLSSELFIHDPRDLNGTVHPTIVGSVAGFPYYLKNNRSDSEPRPVRQIRVWLADQLLVTLAGISNGSDKDNYANAFLTLVDPDGNYILQQHPLVDFVQPNKAVGVFAPAPMYFHRNVLPLPRMSFIEYSANASLVLAPITFIYA